MDESHFYHSCSKGLKEEILFASEKEFIAGMNRIGICLLHCKREGKPVAVISFCLLSNHVHFILHGSEDACRLFMEKYRRLTSIWIANHREEKLHEKIEVGQWLVPDREKLQEKIIYVLRNAMDAGNGLVPHGYRWCSANLIFFDNSYTLRDFRKISDLGSREYARIFNTKEQLPGSWLVGTDGLIWPGCYTNYKAAEKQFGDPRRLISVMSRYNIVKEGMWEEMQDFVSVPDGDIRDRAKEIMQKLFEKEFISRCSFDERILMAKMLKKEYRCNYKQLARILRLKIEDLQSLV